MGSSSSRKVMKSAPIQFTAVTNRERGVACAEELHPSRAELHVSVGVHTQMDLCRRMAD